MILIKGVQVVDGTGKKPYKAEVFLKDDKISAIGSFPHKKADIIIDGLGSFLAPGFIDVKTNSDHYLSLFHNPGQADFLKQGVTTIIGGHCGASLAPLIYGSLESVRKWADINSINVGWHTMREFLDVLERRRLGVNFATLVGHSTIRRALVGESLRDLSEKEMKIFKNLVEQSIKEGAFGLSTGLGYVHARQTPYSEIKELAQLVAKNNGVYTTHLRNEKEGLIASIGETVKLAEETGVKTIISHFRPILGFEKDYQDALFALSNIPSGTEIYFDNYPFDASVAAIYTLLPTWVQNGGLEIMLENLENAATREKILNELPDFKGNEIVVSRAIGADYLVGKSIKDIAKNQEISVKEALLRVMSATNLRATVFYKNVNGETANDALFHQNALVASNSAGLADEPGNLKHERYYNTFPKFLEIAAKGGELPFEEAVKKITSVPARIFGLKNRGIVKEGNIADLTLLKGSKIEAVIVGGKLAVKNGETTSTLAGKILRKS